MIGSAISLPAVRAMKASCNRSADAVGLRTMRLATWTIMLAAMTLFVACGTTIVDSYPPEGTGGTGGNGGSGGTAGSGGTGGAGSGGSGGTAGSGGEAGSGGSGGMAGAGGEAGSGGTGGEAGSGGSGGTAGSGGVGGTSGTGGEGGTGGGIDASPEALAFCALYKSGCIDPDPIRRRTDYFGSTEACLSFFDSATPEIIDCVSFQVAYANEFTDHLFCQGAAGLNGCDPNNGTLTTTEIACPEYQGYGFGSRNYYTDGYVNTCSPHGDGCDFVESTFGDATSIDTFHPPGDRTQFIGAQLCNTVATGEQPLMCLSGINATSTLSEENCEVFPGFSEAANGCVDLPFDFIGGVPLQNAGGWWITALCSVTTERTDYYPGTFDPPEITYYGDIRGTVRITYRAP